MTNGIVILLANERMDMEDMVLLACVGNLSFI